MPRLPRPYNRHRRSLQASAPIEPPIPEISPEQLAAFTANHNTQEKRYRYASRIDPRLLQTCRLIYLETRFLPVLAKEHVFWGYRAPPGVSYASDPIQYFERLTEEQKDHVDRVHFFTQQYYLEGDFQRACAIPDMRPRSLQITLRHGDWWDWEINNRLELKPDWEKNLIKMKRLEELILELETMDRDKEQIYDIATRLSKAKYPLQDGRVLSTAGNPIIKSDWMGPSRWQGLQYNKEKNRWIRERYDKDTPDPGLKYCIVFIKWTAVRV